MKITFYYHDKIIMQHEGVKGILVSLKSKQTRLYFKIADYLFPFIIPNYYTSYTVEDEK